MAWIIKHIYEDDFGCEERMPGEPLMSRVVLENDEDYETVIFNVADNWLVMQELDEGDEWPEEIKMGDDKAEKQERWMQDYLDALEEME